MGGHGNLPAPDPSALGISRLRGATNQQARPVPSIVGRQRVGVSWISDPFNVYSVKASNNGKGGGESGYNWYADIAAVVCGGPVDALFAIYFNGNIVFGAPNGSTVSGVANTPAIQRITGPRGPWPDSASFSITFTPTPGGTTYNLGSATIYWGTDTQTIDPYLSGNNTHLLNDNAIELYDTTVPIRHSAYRGFCYMVFHNLSLGFNQTSFPNIEVVVGRWPSPDWLAEEVVVGVPGLNDANPIAVIADWLQNPRAGLNIPDSMLDIDGLNAAALQLNSEVFGVSPVVDRQQPAKDLINDLCEYFDGYPYINDDGTFGIGLMRVPADGYDGLPAPDDTFIVKRPEMDADDWSKTISETRVTFKNALYDLTDDYVVFRNYGNRAVNNQMAQPATLDRPYLAWSNFAALLCVGYGLRNSVPMKTGKLTLRRTAELDYYDMPVGTQFIINDASRNFANLMFRVVQRTLPDPGVPQYEITFELDLSYLYPTVDEAQALVGSPDAELVAASNGSAAVLGKVRVFELPLALCPQGKLSMAILAARNDATQSAIQVWLGRNYEQGWPAA